jgi:hypothetical protein
MDTQEPINHTKLLRKWGYKFKHFLYTLFCVLGLRTARVVARDVHGIYAPWDSAPVSVGGVRVGGWPMACGGGGSKSSRYGPYGRAWSRPAARDGLWQGGGCFFGGQGFFFGGRGFFFGGQGGPAPAEAGIFFDKNSMRFWCPVGSWTPRPPPSKRPPAIPSLLTAIASRTSRRSFYIRHLGTHRPLR